MKIYKIERRDDVGYDEFDSMIVAADSEDDAKSIHPYGDASFPCWNNDYGSWVRKEEIDTLLKIWCIGETELKKGVILASFNAG
tara:strand:+ start:171 stop:422 length:252 start_codon:yes stop_codon:yes gene_type:complete